MGRVKGLVVKVDPPRTAAPHGTMLVTISVPKKSRWHTNDDGETWDKIPLRVHKPIRFEVLYDGRPKIGEWITAQVY